MSSNPSHAPAQNILPVTAIGSYPPPTWFRHLLVRRAEGNVSDEDFAEATADAVQAAIRDQEMAGLDLVTDGEIGRLGAAPEPLLAMRETLGFIWGLLARLEGATFGGGGAAGHRYRMTGPLTAPRGLGVAAEFERSRPRAGRPIKATLPGPFSLALALVDPEDRSALDSALAALGPILRAELEALAERGAEEVQLDEPSLGVLLAGDPGRWVEYFNGLVADLPFRLHLHICFRNVIAATRDVPRTYRPLIPYLNDLNVRVIHLEYSLNDMRELELLDDIAYDKQLAIGVVSAHDPEVESPRVVADRIRSCLRHVNVGRLMLAPDCGLSALTRPVARAKLEALCAGAALVRSEMNRGRR